MALDSNFNIQISAIVNANKLRQSVESALKKEFNIKVRAQTSGGVASGDSSIISSSGTKVSGMSATEKQLKRASRAVDNFNTKLINLKTTGGLTDTEFKNFSEQLNSVNSEFQETKNLDNFTDGMHELKNSVSQASTANKAMGQSLTDIIGKFTKWYLIAGGVTAVINMIKQLAVEVVSLDASMVELNKVTDLTSQELENVKKKAFDLGEQLGRTGKEVIDATTEFARMGYTIEESLDLGKVAVMMTNVAEGISDTGEAANILTSILKGTNTEIEYSASLLDRLNEISNNNAVSFDALAHMTQEAAATMDILGNNLDQTMGLLTGAFSVLQDESVANGIQTIGLRIAGLNEDMESVAGLSNQVVEALQRYAGIEAFDEQTGQLKNTYTILEELAGVWDTIDKNKQSALLNTLAGKRQADVAAAILQNWEGVEKAVTDAQNSMGSALEEQEAYLDSIEGRTQKFKNVFQELGDLIIGSDLVKAVIDIGTGLAKIIGHIVGIAAAILKLGGLQIALQGIANVLNIVGDVLAWIDNLIQSISDFIKPVTDWVSYYLGFGWLADLIDGNNEAEQSNKDLSDSFDKAEESVSEYDIALRKLIADTQQYISLLEDKDQIESLAERIEFIEDENDNLNKQRELEEKILAIEQARFALAEAKNKKVRVFRAGQGFVYESDQTGVQSAQEELSSAVNELAEFRYELLIERAQEFVDAFNELVSGDQSEFIEGWEKLFDKFGDLLDTEFAKYIQKAQEFVDEFNSKTFSTEKNKGNSSSNSNNNKYMLPSDIGDIDWGNSFSPPQFGIRAYASGTNFAEGGTSLVGENGPEIVSLPRGSRVYTASQTSRMLNHLTSSGGSGNSVNVGTVVINEPNNFDGFVNEFCSQLNLPKPVKLTP